MIAAAPPAVSPPVGLADTVRFLKRPDAYPERPERVETVETHMAWVFLTGRFAYKLKKPVRYAYLDFSTIEARRLDAMREVRLNRRLAPGVYLGIVPLTWEPDAAGGTFALNDEGEVVDWLVRMCRLPAERMLDRAIQDRTATEEDVERAARLLAGFYRDSRPG